MRRRVIFGVFEADSLKRAIQIKTPIARPIPFTVTGIGGPELQFARQPPFPNGLLASTAHTISLCFANTIFVWFGQKCDTRSKGMLRTNPVRTFLM